MFIYILILIIILLLYLSNSNSNCIEKMKNYNIYDKIDIIYYINLDDRKDRNEQFLTEMKKIDFPLNKIVRISAIKNKNGAIGCTSSHIYTLKKFIESNYNNCLIFEDDFEFTCTREEFIKQISNLFNTNIKFDVVCLSSNIIISEDTEYSYLKKLINAQTTSSYLTTREYVIKYLLENFIIGKYLLENNNKPELYAIDQYWKLLQKEHNWYCFNPKLGKQRESYSDIQKGIVNYEVFTNIK